MVYKSIFRQFNFSKISILHNTAILYFVLFLSTINLVSYGLIRDYFTPTIFILVATITSFFSMNMTVILSIALVSSNIIKQGPKIRFYEGMQTSDKKDDAIDKVTSAPDILSKTNSTDTPLPEERKSDEIKNLKVIEDKYTELLMLQDKILGNITALEDSLGSAEKIVKSMSKTVSLP